MSTPVAHPEIERLRTRCADLRRRLRSVVEEWHQMVTIERPRLSMRYDQLFGELERERQRLALQSAELFRRVELLSIKASRGEQITPEIVDLINAVVDKEYARLRQRLRDALDMDATERESAAKARSASVADHEVTTMYRTLAKRLHPDAAGESEEMLATWHRVQQAYHDRDAARLRTLLALVGADQKDDTQVVDWDLLRWEQEERELSARLRIEVRKVETMKAEEPFSISAGLDDQSWLDRHRDELQAGLRAIRSEIVENKRHYVELTGGTMPPEAAAKAGKRDPDFDEEFFENTYFGGR